MENTKNRSSLFIGFAIIIASIIVAYTVNSYWQKKLLIEAVDGCGKTNIAHWTDPNTGADMNQPYTEAYEKCLKDKGY